MPQRNRRFLTSLLPLGLLAMTIAIVRRRPDDWEYEPIEEDAPPVEPPPAAAASSTRRPPARRIALAAGFTTLFFAGASFTAGAGDQMAKLMEEDAAALEAAQLVGAPGEASQTVPEAPAADAPAPEAPAPEAPAAEAPAPEASAPEAAPEAAPAPAEAVPAEAAPVEVAPEVIEPSASTAAAQAAEPAEAEAAPAAPAPSNVTAPAPAGAATPADAAPAAKPAPAASKPSGTKQWVVKRAAEPPAHAPEIEHEGPATVWLNRALPDPTPASARLSRPFARQLVATSKRHGADWASVLAILRAQGERGSAPATARQLDTLARRIGKTKAWNAALSLSGRTGFADRAQALADLYRFVGVEALVNGYAASKDRLAKKVLSTPGVLIYAGGRSDILMGRIDVRILTLVGYLAERHGSVTVSSLFSGHRMFSRPGVVSAHMYGHAVDVAAIGGTPIAGSQQPGGLTEAAVRSVLLLPSELQPRQVISLLGLGGPSFPMRDHADHIHVGY